MNELLERIMRIDFANRGEGFVESYFLVPLLESLGYQQQKDYEVIVHGDDGANFKLKYPPVEKGAKAVKHYNPDYIPTIRKKSFWIIEAKSPKAVPYPFEYKYIVQGLQYCFHPEIQATFLVVSNGMDTCVYDVFSAAFLEGDFYEPILHFKHTDIVKQWPQIFALLSNEKVRERVEARLILHYEKLAGSSLDKDYPSRLWQKIGSNRRTISTAIEKHCARLYLQGMDDSREDYLNTVTSLSGKDILEQYMNTPLQGGKTESDIYIEKRLEEITPEEVFTELTCDYETQSIFRKEHTFVALARLFQRSDAPFSDNVLSWMLSRKDEALNRLNRNEAIQLRITRKFLVISIYPDIREKIAEEMQFAPEIVRFVNKPSSLQRTYPLELMIHNKQFKELLNMTDEDLDRQFAELVELEKRIENLFQEARKELKEDERQILGFEWYGHSGKHYAFNNIMLNMKLIKRSE